MDVPRQLANDPVREMVLVEFGGKPPRFLTQMNWVSANGEAPLLLFVEHLLPPRGSRLQAKLATSFFQDFLVANA
jgi:hypothetical protein